MHNLELIFLWQNERGASGVAAQHVRARHPRKHYDIRLERHVAPGPWEAARNALCAAAVVAFQDATGLLRSDAGPKLFPQLRTPLDLPPRAYFANWPEGFDHTRVWRSAGGRHLITTEPYAESEEDYGTAPAGAGCDSNCERAPRAAIGDVLAACAGLGWPCHVMPQGIGLWNPPLTRLVLVSPGKLGLPLAPIAAALDGRMPVFR
jgi:hypothetical protein